MTRTNQSGQVLIGAAVAMVVLAGFAGLAIDMGTLRYQKRLQQTAADAAALAGASNLTYSGWQTGAQNAAIQNGFTDASSNDLSKCATGAAVGTVCVQANNGPKDVTLNGATILGGPHAGDTNYVEAIVAVVQPTYFMTIFGVNSETIVARAVATNTGGGAASTGTGCVYTLGVPTAKVKLSTAGVGANGNAVLNAPTCGINDNGNLDAVGSVQVVAGAIGVGGQYSPPSQQSTCTPGVLPANGVCPTPVTGVPYTGDPFSGKYPTPTAPGPGTVTTTNNITTFTPGTYASITVNSNSNDVFSPGVYVVTGTFKINGGANVCGGGIATFTNGSMTCTQDAAGDGVTFYLSGANASLSINGTSNTQMYAPNSGTYEGLLFYQDPADTQQATINGTNNSLFQGAIYMPSADLTFGGNSTFNNGAAYTVIVTDQFNVSGNTNVNLASNLSGLANGGGPLAGIIKWATLVE